MTVHRGTIDSRNRVWNTATMAWEPEEQASTGGVAAGSTTVTVSTGTVSIGNTVNTLSGLSVGAHDYSSMTYTGSNLTQVVFKSGGSGGTIVATLTLAYSGSDLTSVTKS